MLDMKPPPPISCFSTLLSSLIRCEHFSVAISFYKRLNLSRVPGLRPDLFIFNVLPNCYSSMKLGSAGFSAFGVILRNGYRPDVFSFNSVLKGLCLEEKLVEAVGLLAKMFRLGCAPNIVTYNTLIDGLCKTGNVTTAFQLHREMVHGKAVAAKEGCRPFTVSYTLIDGGSIEWPLVDANGKDARFSPDVFSYNCLIDGLCKTGNVATALQLHREMVHGKAVAAKEGCRPCTVSYTLIDGGSIEWPLVDANGKDARFYPDVFSYSCLIDGLCRSGMEEDAKSLLREMIGRGVYPNEVTYTIVIDLLCKKGKVEEAMEVLEKMISRGKFPDTVTYSIIVDGYCRIGKIETALSLYKDTNSRGIFVNVVTMNTLLKGLFLARKVGDAMSLFRNMKKRDVNGSCGPNVFNYATMIYGLCEEGHVDKAEELFQELQEEGICPDACVYSSLIDGLCKHGHVGKAQKLFLEMLASGVSADEAPYSALIDGFCKEGDMHKAKELFMQMQSSGLFPSSRTFNILVDGFYRSGNVEEANAMLEKMIRDGTLPTAVTFKIIVNNLGKKGSMEQGAQKVISLMESCGYECDAASYNALIRGYCKAGMLEDALNLLAEMEPKGCCSDAVTFEMLILGFAQKTENAKVKELIQKMHNIRISSNSNTTSTLLECINKDDDEMQRLNHHVELFP